MFHLGTLSYLHRLRLGDGGSFLEMVNTISAVSGGTITGLWYMLQYARGGVSDDSFRELYRRLRDSDVTGLGLRNLLRNKSDSFIREMAAVYDEVFFGGACFDVILDKIDNGRIHHFSANGTDFSNGLGFRFQAARKAANADSKHSRGVIGNSEHRIPREVAGRVRLSEILAVSSCFPAGFEPMFFPSDFRLRDDASLKAYTDGLKEDIPLMDGGIVDNQGIEPILLANAQMQMDDGRARGRKDFPCLDLIIVSDVSTRRSRTVRKHSAKRRGKTSLRSIDICTDALLCAGAASCFLSSGSGRGRIFGFVLCLTILLAAVRVSSWMLKRLVRKAVSKSPVKTDASALWAYPLKGLAALLLNRGSSFLLLAKAVFMKPIRQMRYRAVYESDIWHNRRITNAIYELTAEYGSWKSKLASGGIPEWLAPSKEMQENSKMATDMKTTLWFTAADRRAGVPEALLACGQYNICMNLLEYIHKLKNNDSNTTEAHKRLMKFESQLRADWEKFKKDPLWLVRPMP